MHKPIYLFVSPFFPTPESWRGGFCYDMARALVREGTYDVRVFVPGDGPDYDMGGLHVVRFKQMALPCGAFPYLLWPCNKVLFLHAIKKTGINFEEIAICHSHGFAGYANAVKERNNRCLSLLHHHCLASIRRSIGLGRFGLLPLYADVMYLWTRREHMQIDCHVFCSERSRETYGLCFQSAPEDRWRDVRKKLVLGCLLPEIKIPKGIVFYNGFDEHLFFPAPQRHSGFVIGCVANFQPLKDHMTLLRAFDLVHREFPETSLRLVGSGETRRECEKYVVRNGLTRAVSFEKEFLHNDLPRFFHAIDLFVLPSRLEGFCCVYMESIGCGVPFLACQGCSCEEVLTKESKTEFLVPPLDCKLFALKIKEIYLNRTKKPTLTRNMTYTILVKDYLVQLDSLLCGRSFSE